MSGVAPTLMVGGGQVLSTVSATTVIPSWAPVSQGSTTWILVVAAHAVGAFTDTTTVTGNNLTWVKQLNVVQGDMQVTVFTARGLAPTTGTTTVVLSQIPAAGLVDIIQAHATGDVAQAVSGSAGAGTTGTATFGSIANSGELLNYAIHRVAEGATKDGTTTPAWVEVDDGTTTGIGLEAQYVIGGQQDLTCTATWATSAAWIEIALEMDPADWAGDLADDGGLIANGSMVGQIYDCSDEGPNVPGNPSGVWAYLESD